MNRQASGSGELSRGQLDALREEIEQAYTRLQVRVSALETTPEVNYKPTDTAVHNNSFTANEGQHCIIEAPVSGLTVTLPHARPQNRNARITFTLRNSNPVRFIAVDGKVNNRSSGVMAAPGTFDAISDGSTGWAISVLAAGPTALGPPLAADFVVGVANPGLPNARVATASVEITPSIAVANVISWALNASSIVFAKLANLTGLSVLGRAANSAGVMAAITATGAQQYFRSNAAGTSLEWADPASASIVNTGVTFQRAALSGAVQAALNSNVTSFGNLAALSVLANATNASAIPAALAGTAAFQHLRVNATTTALEWSVLTSGDFPAGTVPLSSMATQANDTFVGNVSGGVASPVAVALSSLAGAGLVFGIHTLDVTAGAGASLVVSANDIQRGALTGAVTAAQDSNATTFRSFAAKSVLANATNAAAVPSDFAGTVANTYLRVNAANTALEYGALPAGVMPTIQPGSFLGLQITAGGAAAAVEITGKEAGENIRFDSEILDTTTSGSTVDYVLFEDRNWIHFSNAAALTLHGVSVLSASGGTALHPEGKPYIVSCGSASGGLDLIQQSATETNAARRFQNPGQIDFHMFPGETSLVVRKLISATTNHRVIGRARSAVQANGGAISPAETLNFVNGTGTTATAPVTAGVAAVAFDTVKAAQSDLYVGSDAVKVLTAALSGFPPGVSANATILTQSASTTRNAGATFVIPSATQTTGGRAFLLYGYCVFTRGATATALNLVFTANTGPSGSPVARATFTIPAATGGGSYSGLVLAFLNILTVGVSGTATVQVFLPNIFRTGAVFGPDMSFATGTFTMDTTQSQVIDIGVAMSAGVAATSTAWTNAAVLRIR